MRRIIAVLALLAGFASSAAHLVGGEITYTCLGANQYQVKLRIYRDCFSGGAAFDNSVNFSVYNLAGTLVTNPSVPKGPTISVPAGTGNDFARSNNLLTTSPSAIFDVIYSEGPKEIDTGRISFASGERKFCQILSTGFDAQVNERANRTNLVSGKMKYNFAMIGEIQKFRTIGYELEIDGKCSSFDAMLIAVANGQTYGGGMRLCPMADRRDGLLDILILHPVSKPELMKVFPKVYSGRHVTHPAVEFQRARSVKIAADTVAYADGERIGRLPITVEVVPKSLRTWTLN
jgi:diacylglycerol kinase (ATP)